MLRDQVAVIRVPRVKTRAEPAEPGGHNPADNPRRYRQIAQQPPARPPAGDAILRQQFQRRVWDPVTRVETVLAGDE